MLGQIHVSFSQTSCLYSPRLWWSAKNRVCVRAASATRQCWWGRSIAAKSMKDIRKRLSRSSGKKLNWSMTSKQGCNASIWKLNRIDLSVCHCVSLDQILLVRHRAEQNRVPDCFDSDSDSRLQVIEYHSLCRNNNKWREKLEYVPFIWPLRR